MAVKTLWEPREKGRISPSLRKILMLMLLLFVPILLAGAGFLIYSLLDAQESSRERIAGAVEKQLTDLDGTLSTVSMYLTDTLMNSSYVEEIAASTDPHQANVAARSLWGKLDSQGNLWPGSFNFFFYCPPKSLTLSRFDNRVDYSDNNAICQLLKKNILAGSAGANRLLWTSLEVNGNAYLIQVYFYGSSYLSCWIPCDSAFSFLQNAVLTDKGLYAVLDSSGEPLLGYEFLEENKIALDHGVPKDSHWGEFCAVYGMRRADIRLLVADTPYIDEGNLLFLLAFFCVTLLIVLAFAAYTLLYFHRYIEAPFRQFQTRINEYASVRSSVKQRGFAELDEAVEAFDSLSQQLNDLKIDVYEEKLALAKTELEYFQLQIRPHFFVNSFSILFGMAQKKDYARIQDFCLKLSDYVRYLFRDGFSTVTVGEELSIIKEYLEIQNIRYRTGSELLDLSDTSLLSCPMPPLILLSFVENAVKYASVENRNLVISVGVSRPEQEPEGRLRLTVTDNGKGIPADTLELYNSLSPEQLPETDGTRVGTYNIYKRLYLLYGSRFSLRFSNSETGGAMVEIILPDGSKNTEKKEGSV